jgi:DNA repair exonuclease SbcCD ATPase subunit
VIPRSVKLKGFLCYKDEQAIDLDGYDLWVLSGRNGSGKSAIFDAMRFALFKAHRGGKQDAKSLIHTEASELSISFEFDLGAERYRIKRTVPRRGSAECGIYRFAPEADGSEHWLPLPDAQSDAGLRQWVQDHIGLTDETFVASVLLLQGESDRLLKAPPKGRHEILAGILDLESYRRLHRRADERRLREKGRAELLRHRLQGLLAIDPKAIEQAESELARAEGAWDVAEKDWMRLVECKAQAMSWLDLTGRRKKACALRESAQQLLTESEAIGREWARLQELDVVLPTVRGAIERRRTIQDAEAEVMRADGEIRQLSRRLDLVAALEEENRHHLDSIFDEIEGDERRVAAILNRQAELAVPMARAGQARARAEEVRTRESVLATYPVDLAEQVATSEQDHRLCLDWKAALPSLDNLLRERVGLTAVRDRMASARGEIQARAVKVEQAAAELASRCNEVTALREAEGEASQRWAVAEAHAGSAARYLAEFSALQGETRCDRCGQELTPAHFADEEARRREDQERAAEAVEQARGAHRAAKHQLEAAGLARDEAEKAHRRAVDNLDLVDRELDKAEEDADRHARACRNAYDQLEEPFRLRVSAEPPDDWLTSTYPALADLAEGRDRARRESTVRSRLEELRKDLAERETAEKLLEQARLNLASIGLQPGDDAAEAEHEGLQTERKSLDHCLAGHQVQKKQAEETRDQLARHRRRLEGDHQAALRGRDGALNLAGIQRQEQARARAELSLENWCIAFDTAAGDDLVAWDRERESLQAAGVKERAEELSGAHSRLRQAEEEMAELDAELAALPDDARRPPEEVASNLAEAERRRDEADGVRRRRQDVLGSLHKALEDRVALEKETLAAELDLAIAETLARLLGRDGLQRDLIRDAERGIVAYANPILREISGGELELRLLDVAANEPDHALQLEAIERIQGRTGTRGVEYLSGSQKFRVAVSLALAIGQYACGSKERPIKSVIIDEGFGGLDRQGRDEMIEQLNALRGRLARIILVSHQEEFAEAFRDGYHMEVVDGSTVARPFHR